MRFFPAVALTLLMTGGASAQMIFWNDDRRVTVSGFAQTPPQPSSNYFAAESRPIASGPFEGSVSGEANAVNPERNDNGFFDRNRARSSAAQQSSLSPVQMAFSSDIQTEGQGFFGNSGPNSYRGFGESIFEVTFSVLSFLPYEFTLERQVFESNGSTALNCYFSSANDGMLWTWDPNVNQGSRSGTLSPGDVYTFYCGVNATAETPDFLAVHGNISVDGAFTIVPEPAAAALLLAGALFFAVRRPDR